MENSKFNETVESIISSMAANAEVQMVEHRDLRAPRIAA